MSKIKPSLPKGTRDFGPIELRKRQYIFNTIKSVFEKYGYQPIETPVMENLSTLEGKYGEEGDKLLFRILNSGDAFQKFRNDEGKISNFEFRISDLCEKGLRYDLTIPFARYVVMHQNDITFPFKRYQIQPVWRADRPQKGRYREFYQCDADVIGSDSLLNEVELVLIYDEVFDRLGIDVKILFNSRKILQGIADYCGCSDRLDIITSSIDKLDKIGRNGVVEELSKKGISKDKIERIFDCIEISPEDYVFDTIEDLIASGLSEEEAQYEWGIENNRFRKDFGILNCLKEDFELAEPVSQLGLVGISESKKILSLLFKNGVKSMISFDSSLARGLDYYTGTIFEVKATALEMGSIGGGGRYDNLTGVFGLPNVSGVGISFGIERIYDVMEELELK
jgi:histidyl-tRNA synthetase